MALWLTVWLVITLVTTVMLIAVLVALVRQSLLLGRTARRMAEEAGPLTSGIGDEAQRASQRLSGLTPPRPSGRARGGRARG